MQTHTNTMGWDVFAWMKSVRDSSLPPVTRLVLLTMVTWIDNRTGLCFPSLQTLAEGTGLAKSTVAVHLRRAEEAGFLRRTQRKRGRQHTSTLYKALTPNHGPAWDWI